MKVLLWTEERMISEFFSNELQRKGVTVTSIIAGLHEVVNDTHFNLIILVGVSFSQRAIHIRKSHPETPIYIIGSASRSVCLSILRCYGITWVANPLEDLLTEIVKCSNQKSKIQNQINCDFRERVVWKEGERIELSKRENEVLSYLFNHRNKIVYKDEIIRSVWSGHVEDANVYMTIKKVRDKLEEDPSNPRYLVTRRGGGYMFVYEE